MVIGNSQEVMNFKTNTGATAFIVVVATFLASIVISIKNLTAKTLIFGSVPNTPAAAAPVAMIGASDNSTGVVRQFQPLVPRSLTALFRISSLFKISVGYKADIYFAPIIKCLMPFLKTHRSQRRVIALCHPFVPCRQFFKVLAGIGMMSALVIGIPNPVTANFNGVRVKNLITATSADFLYPTLHAIHYTKNIEGCMTKVGEFREALPDNAGGNPEPSQGYTLGRCNDYRRGIVLLITGQSAHPEREEIVCASSNGGKKRPYTKKLKTLSQIEIDGATRRALRNDMVKVLDSAVHAQFDAAKIRYVGTATDGGAFTTNGTATATCTSQLNKYHVKAIVDYLQKNMLAPPYDGNSYMAIVTVAAHNGLYTDVEAVMQYTKYPANGEFGMYYNCRFVKETHILDNDMGNGSLYGQAFFFGEETVAEAVAEAEHIMFQPDYVDFQRNPALAWYFIGGFKIMHFANPDNRIVKYTSVEVN